MKLRWVKAYTTAAGKDYGRFDVALPPDLVEKKGWEKGTDLEAIDHKDGILLRRAK